MFVAAATNCFRDLPLESALDRIADLEYSKVEIMFHESNAELKPSYVASHLNETAARLRNLRRLTPIGFSLEIDTEDKNEYFRQFMGCLKLAHVFQVVTLTVRAAPWGFPFNEEVERLRVCVAEAQKRGMMVGLLTERDRLSESLDTAKSLCQLVPGLALTLDPSQYVYQGPENIIDVMEPMFDLVCHVRLRDSSPEKLQTCVGQGTLEFGQFISRLENHKYQGAFSVDINPDPNLDISQELRKMRLLLDSIL